MHIRKFFLSFLTVLLFFFLFFLPVRAEAASLESTAGVVATSSGRLNVRSGPSTGSTVVTSLSKGSYVTLLSKSGDWWHIEYARGRYGYCHSSYITSVSGTAARIQTQSGNLNVRSGPGTTYSRVSSLAKGEIVVVLSTNGGWSRILYNGTSTGYVSSQYLSTYYAPVSLDVPNFKQTDSRWASVQIGRSGKTMAQIGCATTAIAMMESRRTGTTIYPDTMAGRLTYTDSGNVYWPPNYVTVTNGTGYLPAIYRLLSQGKPVLLGCRNAYGSQHWVVVTGFTGGTVLSATSFKILDPGSNSRVNLQQFLDLYPTFYKYFHY